MATRPDPPFEGGARRVVERRAEMPASESNLGQYLVVGLGILVLIACLLWILVPLGG